MVRCHVRRRSRGRDDQRGAVGDMGVRAAPVAMTNAAPTAARRGIASIRLARRGSEQKTQRDEMKLKERVQKSGFSGATVIAVQSTRQRRHVRVD